MKNSMGKVLGFLVKAKEELSEEEFKEFIAMNATISLSVIRESEGDEFYEGFIQGAIDKPMNLKLEKGTLQ